MVSWAWWVVGVAWSTVEMGVRGGMWGGDGCGGRTGVERGRGGHGGGGGGSGCLLVTDPNPLSR